MILGSFLFGTRRQFENLAGLHLGDLLIIKSNHYILFKNKAPPIFFHKLRKNLIPNNNKVVKFSL